MSKIDLLDHGFVRLVDHMGSDLSVVRAARISYDAEWRAGQNEGSDSRLIKRLWRDKHTSPFESVVFTFEVKAPIFIFRQWHRHRTWAYNEISGRYSVLPEEFYIPRPEDVGIQSKDNKQGRSTLATETERDLMMRLREKEIRHLRDHCAAGFELYRDLIRTDWPRELARLPLPLNTYSHMFGTVNMLNLFRFLMLRAHEHAQMEIRVYADAMIKLMSPIAPVCAEAFCDDMKRSAVISKLLKVPLDEMMRLVNEMVEEKEGVS